MGVSSFLTAHQHIIGHFSAGSGTVITRYYIVASPVYSYDTITVLYSQKGAITCQHIDYTASLGSVLDSGAEGPGFKSQSRRCRVTVLGKLFTPTVPLFTKQRNW